VAAKTPVSATATGNKTSAKGLQLSAAQWKAYHAAFAATAQRLRYNALLQARATGMRKYRLAAAYSSLKRAAASRAAAQTSAIAAYAARRTYIQSRLGHQNAALQARVELAMYRHANLTGRLQYIQGGEKAYAHRAVMRTVTQAQAVTAERAILSKAYRVASKAGRSTTTSRKTTPLSRAITAQAQAAGLKAAKAAVGRTAPPPWAGNETTPNCVVMAIANHLIACRGLRADEASIRELEEMCGPEPTIEEALWNAWMMHFPRGHLAHIGNYQALPEDELLSTLQLMGHLIVGYQSANGPHAAVTLSGGQVISWGEVIEREKTPVEEAWIIEWVA
jgi:hypothetical protein